MSDDPRYTYEYVSPSRGRFKINNNLPPNIHHIIIIPKIKGDWRYIYVPTLALKRHIADYMNDRDFFRTSKFPPFVHGFVKRRSAITNALMHVNKQFTMNFDLENFFESITLERLQAESGLSGLNENCFIYDEETGNHFVPQGFSSSPFLANLAAEGLDKSLINLCERNFKKGTGEPIIYSRYADDLTFSFDKIETATYLRDRIPQAVSMARFKINPKKTRLQYAKGGRRMVTGIAVDTGIRVPRRLKRKLRAILFNQAKFEATPSQVPSRGILGSWIQPRFEEVKDTPFYKLSPIYARIRHIHINAARGLNGYLHFIEKTREHKTEPELEPKLPFPAERSLRELHNLLITAYHKTGLKRPQNSAKVFRFIPPKLIPETTQMTRSNEWQFAITNDPVYIAGMSLFTPGWHSCMNLWKGERRNGFWFWILHPGASLAVLIDRNNSIIYGGVSRPAMLARTILYQLESGKVVHGRVYPGNQAAQQLDEWLQQKNIPFISEEDLGKPINGIVQYRGEIPYLDNTTVISLPSMEKRSYYRSGRNYTRRYVKLIAGVPTRRGEYGEDSPHLIPGKQF